MCNLKLYNLKTASTEAKNIDCNYVYRQELYKERRIDLN